MRRTSPARPSKPAGTSSAAMAGLLAVVGAVLVALCAAAQQTPPETEEPPPGEVPYIPLLLEHQRAAITDALDAKRALRHIERLSGYHRLAPSSGLDRAMRYIARELRAAGLEAIETTTYKSDGKATWWVEPAPPAWTCDAAELWIEAPERRQLADWSAQPIRLAAYSTSCDVTADVVEVTDWEAADLDLEGKIALTSGDARTLHAKAVEAGAVGLLLSPEDQAQDGVLAEAVHPSSLSPALEDWKTNRFAFNISAAEAAALRAWLDAGKPVRARARIENARTAPSACPIVSARIPGDRRSTERVILLAEVAGPSPGANGVSGAGALLSLARTYKELVDQGVLLPPVRHLEFLFVPDVHGACAYVNKHRHNLDEIHTVIQLGVVGTNTESGPGEGRLLQIADGGWLLPNCVSHLALTFGRYVARSNLVDVAGSAAPLAFLLHARDPVSAHAVFYSGEVGRPAVAISFGPDPSTGTSIDTPERLDTTALMRTMYMAVGTAYTLATPTQMEVQNFGPLISPYVIRDLSGGLDLFVKLVALAPTERVPDVFHRCDVIMERNRRRAYKTPESLELLVADVEQHREAVKQFRTDAHTTFSEMASAVVKTYDRRVLDENLPLDLQKKIRMKDIELNREIAAMRWNGPVTAELLQRHAPEVFPLPQAIDVPTLFALVTGERGLFEIWAEHEAIKWIGLPFPLPPPEQLTLPANANLDETVEFLRRCAQAGVIRIEKE